MAAVAGLRGTGNWGTDERPKNFREAILFRNPTGSSPIFGLTSRARKKTVDDPEFSWWDEPNDLVRLTVNGALGSAATTVVVDSADPDATAANKKNAWGLATHLKEGDLLLVEPSADNATFDHEVIKVESVTSATTFQVSRGAGGTTAAAIGDNANLLLIGSAFAEGTSAPTSVSRNPIKYSNYTQIFKDAYELTGTADQTRARTGQAWSNDKKRKMFDHSRAIEFSILFGRKDEGTGENGKPLRYMDGLRPQIANVNVFGAAVTTSSFLDAVYPVFDFDTPAGDSRIGFCGNVALNELNKVVQGNTNTEISFGGVVGTYGMNFREFIMPQGRLLMRTHPLLNRHPLYRSSMFILDFASIAYVPLRNRDTKVKDDVQADDEDVRRGYIQTECSLAVERGGTTMGYLGNISAT